MMNWSKVYFGFSGSGPPWADSGRVGGVSRAAPADEADTTSMVVSGPSTAAADAWSRRTERAATQPRFWGGADATSSAPWSDTGAPSASHRSYADGSTA